MKVYEDCSSFEVDTEKLKPRGWARRPKHGEQYGKKYIAEFACDIEELFNVGKSDSEKKLNARTMLERLRRKYPKRYTLPSETTLKQEISKLFDKQKKNTSKETASGDNNNRSYAKFPEIYANAFKRYMKEVEDASTIKPKEAYDKLVEDYTDENGRLPSDFPSYKQGTSKFSGMKTSYRKQLLKEIL
mmetsp:Transcript_17789/g.21924  ORF Transcript_17789/g.21924 Transcript_17789/m.21924 type:complete len:188 (-) Transcript_17789:469-1032(-)